ncbi:MAG: hypothetical protein L3J18_15105 [Candidatus Brocadia sp.]|nr:hypothetical protein [Candidatus Brocadia sp.]MDG5996249.1 hypothetical protein [Candidatus Brocadia sp.]UJS20210.1 MAG: hypothetical protein L3J18_15105 [Candidatus Brocadia sp.]
MVIISKILIRIPLFSIWCFPLATVNAQEGETGMKLVNQMPDYGLPDQKRVDEFLLDFKKPTGHISREQRAGKLDDRIRNARLTLADKIEAFKRVAPRADATSQRKELRMERLLISVAPEDLPLFKFVLEYDGDYKDMVEYVFSDIDDKECQGRILNYLRTVKQQAGIKVLTDVDDTMYANLIDDRYPGETRYPGVLEFYDSLKQEPFDLQVIPVTTLSARPNPIAGIMEEDSLKKLGNFSDSTGRRLCPSALSGDLGSSVIGTVETLLREKLHPLHDKIPHGQENKIGEVKFMNFEKFSKVYPEYRYVFAGDSGQADALTAQKMITSEPAGEAARVITTFIHDLRESDADVKSVSPAFRSLKPDIVIRKTSPQGRGVIVFRNYIDAAVTACLHSATLENLITAEELAEITWAALRQFQIIDFKGKEASKMRLRAQYREDAEESLKLLTKKPSVPQEVLRKIRSILDEKFQQ